MVALTSTGKQSLDALVVCLFLSIIIFWLTTQYQGEDGRRQEDSRFRVRCDISRWGDLLQSWWKLYRRWSIEPSRHWGHSFLDLQPDKADHTCAFNAAHHRLHSPTGTYSSFSYISLDRRSPTNRARKDHTRRSGCRLPPTNGQPRHCWGWDGG